MKNLNLAIDVEDSIVEIMKARTVLQVAMEYFECTDEIHRQLLPYQADKIYYLLLAADTLAYNASAELENSVKVALETAREDDENGQAD